MLQRRGAAASSVDAPDGQARGRGASARTNATRYNPWVSGAVLLLVVGAYMTTLDSSSSSSSSKKSSSLQHSSLRSSSSQSHILPNFKPIHPQCESNDKNNVDDDKLFAPKSSHPKSTLFPPFLCFRFRVDCPFLAQGIRRIRRLYDTKFGHGGTHYWSTRRRGRARRNGLGSSRTLAKGTHQLVEHVGKLRVRVVYWFLLPWQATCFLLSVFLKIANTYLCVAVVLTVGDVASPIMLGIMLERILWNIKLPLEPYPIITVRLRTNNEK